MLLLICTAGCIKEKTVPGPAGDRTTATLRSLLANNFTFSMFYTAMRRAGVDTLLDGHAYTLLLPDNNAFAGAGITADSLDRIPVETLRKQILYHVLRGSFRRMDVPQAIDYQYLTMEGNALFTSVNLTASPQLRDTTIYVNGIPAVRQDVMAVNGVIHILQKPLTVPVSSVQYLLEQNPDYSCLVAGFKKFGLWNRLLEPGPFVIMAPTNESFAQHNWDEAAINDMQPETFRPLVFSCYQLNSMFFFNIDFMKLAPPSGPVLLDSAYLKYDGNLPDGTFGFRVLPLNYRELEGAQMIYWYGRTFGINKPDQLAANGIVHQIDKVGVVPDSVKIR